MSSFKTNYSGMETIGNSIRSFCSVERTFDLRYNTMRDIYMH